MTSPRVVIDTSVWVEYLRGKDQALVESVRDLIRAQRAVACGIVLAELLAGVKARKDRNTLKQTMDALDYAEVSRATWILAGEMLSTLMRKGTRVPLTDLVVAAVTLENKCELFTLDSHFDRIPEIKRFHPESG